MTSTAPATSVLPPPRSTSETGRVGTSATLTSYLRARLILVPLPDRQPSRETSAQPRC